jgi:GPI mannosyltransferase 4
LSAFPHQEPRFLIPLLLPICLMYAYKVFGKKSQRSYLFLWAFGNIFCGLFFGVLHQGGVVRALGDMQRQRLSDTENSLVVFWHTYMPPTHLLLIPARTEESGTRGRCPGSFFEVHDFAGRPFEDVAQFARLVHDSHVLCEGKPPLRITLVAPGSLHSDMTCTTCGFRVELVSSYWPHLSTEDLPRVSDLFCYKPSGGSSCDTSHAIQRLVVATSLNVYSFVFVE